MPIWTCSACSTRSTRGGDCIECGLSLGSPKKAVLAAAGATCALSLIWIVLSYLTGIQLSMLAVLYGGLVSGAVVHVSGGRGVLYQVIASAFTLVGMLSAESFVVMLHWERHAAEHGLNASITFLQTFEYLALYDGITIAFCVFGFMGGFWVWRQPDY